MNEALLSLGWIPCPLTDDEQQSHIQQKWCQPIDETVDLIFQIYETDTFENGQPATHDNWKAALKDEKALSKEHSTYTVQHAIPNLVSEHVTVKSEVESVSYFISYNI
jgi:hypothetical protein